MCREDKARRNKQRPPWSVFTSRWSQYGCITMHIHVDMWLTHHGVNFKLSVHTLYGISGSSPVICQSKIHTIYLLNKIIECNHLTFNLFEFSLDSFDSILSCGLMACSCKEVTSAEIGGITLELFNGYKELTDSTEHCWKHPLSCISVLLSLTNS